MSPRSSQSCRETVSALGRARQISLSRFCRPCRWSCGPWSCGCCWRLRARRGLLSRREFLLRNHRLIRCKLLHLHRLRGGRFLIHRLCHLVMVACAAQAIAVESHVSSALRVLAIGASLFTPITIAFAAIRARTGHDYVTCGGRL